MKTLFQKLIKENKLAHGYIFFGPDIKDRQEFSSWLTSFLEKENKILFDLMTIDHKDGTIGIDQIRQIKSFLWQKPIQSLKRTVVVNEAHYLTLEAQNSILKIAEEPPAHALIILLIKDHSSLIGTLVSRFQKIYLAGEIKDIAPLSIKKYVNDFLKGSALQRKNIIKEMLEQEGALDGFVRFLMLELNRDPKKNWRILKELLHRWTLICQYNVNKRLQLEAFSKVL